MPAYKPRRLSIWGKLFLIALTLGYLFLVYQLPWSLILVGILFIFSYINNKKYKRKILEIANSRPDYDIGNFAKSFDCRQVDTWIIRAVYEQTQKYLESIYPEFPLHPEDKIYEDIFQDPDDFEMDLVDEIAQRSGRSLDNIEKNPYSQKLETIRDVVLMFNEQPKVTA